ncbi:MAG TPA: VOC family protein [Candidatus Eisenbacteria bacterium]|nr:VOC family protein [Candidatus Eisenbacteria bacterium]
MTCWNRLNAEEPLLDSHAAPLFISSAMPIRGGVLGHIVLNVRNLKQSERFYRTVLGMKVSARNRRAKMCFLSFGKEHHDIALMERPGPPEHAPTDGASKLHHFCVYVSSEKEVDDLNPLLKRRKIPVVSGPEFLEVAGNRSISFLDPDGNRVEVACNANKFRYDARRKTLKGGRG